MKYFKLMYNYENDKGAVFGNAKEIKGIDRYDVEKGTKLPFQDDEIDFELDEDEGIRETDYFANDLSWLIVSEKTKKIIESCQNSNLQFIKIKVDSKRGIKLNCAYYLLVILVLEDALDLTNSIYDEFELDNGEKVILIEKYALIKKNIGNHIFRLKGETIPVFISETLKNEFIKNKLSGFDFLQVKVN